MGRLAHFAATADMSGRPVLKIFSIFESGSNLWYTEIERDSHNSVDLAFPVSLSRKGFYCFPTVI